jgi:sialic acid synthase SpsE/quercetin dioxygenase-like cupin family protein
MSIRLDEPLFIFEMANNHMGSLDHGIATIDAFAGVAKRFSFRFAFKFQLRDLDTFIHPDYQTRMDVKYVKRFRETGLTRDQFRTLKEAAEANGFISMCTPFDERSVDAIEEMGFHILKIASCSLTDWPLLERIVKTDLPLIASTAGAGVDDIDRVVSFFQHREKRFGLMHCVGEYPTRPENLQLNQIDYLRQRYPGVPIGFSTHEAPDCTDSIPIAIAKGANLFEKHVAVEAGAFKKNDYSASPEQAERWLGSAANACRMNGISIGRSPATAKELADLRQFKRGAFAGRRIAAGERIDSQNTFFAFPNFDGQLLANDMSKYIEYYAEHDIDPKCPIDFTRIRSIDTREKVYSIVQRVKKMLADRDVVVPGMATLEISHHYGLDRFEEVGCTIINVINREYCKKLIVVLPGQHHPEQYHKVKEETFMVLDGELQMTLNGVVKRCRRGDVVTVNRGTKHPFSSETGAIIEEISSTHYKDDSYYTDEAILRNSNRKTVLSYWMH